MRPSLIRCVALALCAGLIVTDVAQAQFITRGGGAGAPAPAAPPAALPAPPSAISERAAAVINDEVITNYDLLQRMRLIVAMQRIPDAQINGILPLLRAQALSQLIDQKVELQYLKKESVDRKAKDILLSDKELDAQIDSMASDNNLTRPQFMAELERGGIDGTTYRDYIRADSSWDSWMRSIYRSRLAVSERQVADYQRRMADQASKTQYHVAEIYLDPAKVQGGQTATLQGAADVLSQINSGQVTFQAAARGVSMDSSAVRNGDLGVVTEDDFPAPVAQVLRGLKVGETSAPIVAPDGIYIIQLVEKKEPSNAVMVTLKQAAISLSPTASAADVQAATARLNQVRSQSTGCNDFEAVAGRARGVSVGDLGETQLSDLTPAFRDAASGLAVGQISQPLRSETGLHLIAVCAKRNGGEAQMSHDQVANILAGQQLEAVKRQMLRNLRAQATIVSPDQP